MVTLVTLSGLRLNAKKLRQLKAAKWISTLNL